MLPNHPIPPGWGEDPFTKFLDNCRINQFATFELLKPLSQALINLDRNLDSVVSGIADPESVTAAMLLIRGHAAFRAGVGLTMAGQCPEAFALTRLTLECGAYALLNHNSQEAAITWVSRHESVDALKQAREALGFRNLLEEINRSAPHLSKIFEELYQESIDRGAHPNERAITGAMKIEKTATGHDFLQTQLESDPQRIKRAGRAVARAGHWLLLVVEAIDPDRFSKLGLGNSLGAIPSTS